MILNGQNVSLVEINKKAVLSQGGPRDATVNFDTYRSLQFTVYSLQQHRAFFTVIVLFKNLALLSTFGVRITYVSHFQSQ